MVGDDGNGDWTVVRGGGGSIKDPDLSLTKDFFNDIKVENGETGVTRN